MTTVMELSSPAEEFPLGAVFENVLGVTVELERLIPREALIIPWLWVRDASVEDIEAAFDVHAGVVNVKLIDRLEDEYLLRAGGQSEYFGVLNALAEALALVASLSEALDTPPTELKLLQETVDSYALDELLRIREPIERDGSVTFAAERHSTIVNTPGEVSITSSARDEVAGDLRR